MGHRPVTMNLYMWPLFLASLVQSSLLSSNSDACWDFTVGSCATNANGLVDFYPDINDGGVCELLFIPGMDVTTSAGPNPVRNVKCTLSSLKIVTSSEEPGVLRLRIVFREKNRSKTSS